MSAPRVLKWLGDKGQRVGILILLVSLIALYFNVRTYYTQQSVNVPNLISLAPKIYSNNQTASVVLAWFITEFLQVTGSPVAILRPAAITAQPGDQVMIQEAFSVRLRSPSYC